MKRQGGQVYRLGAFIFLSDSALTRQPWNSLILTRPYDLTQLLDSVWETPLTQGPIEALHRQPASHDLGQDMEMMRSSQAPVFSNQPPKVIGLFRGGVYLAEIYLWGGDL